MGETKIFKEYLKCEIDNFEKFKCVKLDKMFGILYIHSRRSSYLCIIMTLDSPQENKTQIKSVTE